MLTNAKTCKFLAVAMMCMGSLASAHQLGYIPVKNAVDSKDLKERRDSEWKKIFQKALIYTAKKSSADNCQDHIVDKWDVKDIEISRIYGGLDEIKLSHYTYIRSPLLWLAGPVTVPMQMAAELVNTASANNAKVFLKYKGADFFCRLHVTSDYDASGLARNALSRLGCSQINIDTARLPQSLSSSKDAAQVLFAKKQEMDFPRINWTDNSGTLHTHVTNVDGKLRDLVQCNKLTMPTKNRSLISYEKRSSVEIPGEIFKSWFSDNEVLAESLKYFQLR